MKSFSRRTVVASLVLVLGIATLAVAQSEAPSWIEVRVIQVKADKVDEWRELQKNGVNRRSKKRGTLPCGVAFGARQ